MTDIIIHDLEYKKLYLRRYKKNLALINRLEKRIDSIDRRIYTLRSPSYSDMPKGGTPVSVEELISDKEDINKRIAKLKSKGQVYKSEIIDKIDELEDPRYADVLEMFFIDCMTFNEIAEEKAYTERHVKRLYKEGIDSLSF